MIRRFLSCALFVIANTALVGAARADGKTDSVTAQVLFERGRSAMADGKVDEACALFEASLRLDPAVGTLFNLASCEEKDGRLANAWDHYREGIAASREGDPRSASARERVQALEERMPHLSISLDPGSPPGARVVRDGVELTSLSLNAPFPVNPGEHTIVVSLAGHADQTSSFALAERENKEVVVAPGPMETPSPPPPIVIAHVAFTPPRSPVPLRRVAWITGGVGVVTLVGALAAGSVALGESGTIRSHCSSSGACDPQGLTSYHRASDWGTASTIGLGVGAAFVVTGVVLLLFSKSPPARTVNVALEF